MKIKFIVNKKDFETALNSVTLKGKYKSSHTSKVSNISNDVAGAISDDGNTLTLSNASDTLAASITLNITNYQPSEDMSVMFFFEVERVLKYLKTFKYEDMSVTVTQSNLILKTESQRAQIPLLVEHSGIGAITKIMTMKIDYDKIHEGQYPTFGRTTFETALIVEGDELAKAIKNCSFVGNATYKLNYVDGVLSISSINFHQTEQYKVDVNLISGYGEDATLEFSAPIDKFCKNSMFLFLKDDCPILLCGADRRLLVAPYIRG